MELLKQLLRREGLQGIPNNKSFIDILIMVQFRLTTTKNNFLYNRFSTHHQKLGHVENGEFKAIGVLKDDFQCLKLMIQL